MRFTVLTPTYNRAAYLTGLYDSLLTQTFRDFEWVIVDDGSTDGTRELVSSWKPFFPVQYSWKPNGGKHTAINMGAIMARGDFVAIMDSDDRCVPNMLERYDYHWRQIPNPNDFAFVAALCYAEDGQTILGERFPRDIVDSFTVGEALAMARVDRAATVRTEILRKFPYPVFRNERDQLEGVVWNRILRKYGARSVNEALRIRVYAPGGISDKSTHQDRRIANPKGAVVYHAELAFSEAPLGMRLKSLLNAVRFAALAGLREIVPRV